MLPRQHAHTNKGTTRYIIWVYPSSTPAWRVPQKSKNGPVFTIFGSSIQSKKRRYYCIVSAWGWPWISRIAWCLEEYSSCRPLPEGEHPWPIAGKKKKKTSKYDTTEKRKMKKKKNMRKSRQNRLKEGSLKWLQNKTGATTEYWTLSVGNGKTKQKTGKWDPDQKLFCNNEHAKQVRATKVANLPENTQKTPTKKTKTKIHKRMHAISILSLHFIQYATKRKDIQTRSPLLPPLTKRGKRHYIIWKYDQQTKEKSHKTHTSM